jgi:hypothetical protein
MRSNSRVEPPSLDEVRGWGATTDIPRAGACFGIGRSRSYELAKSGDFPVRTIQVGSTHRVLTSELLAVLDPASSASSAA